MDHSHNVVKTTDEVVGIKVKNPAKEELGKIEELMKENDLPIYLLNFKIKMVHDNISRN